MALGAAIVGLVGAGVGAYSAYESSKAQADAAKAGVSQEEAASGAADTTLQKNEQDAQGQQTQDAQWMQMKQMSNSMQGLSTQAPSSLLSLQSANIGSNAQQNAGKIK